MKIMRMSLATVTAVAGMFIMAGTAQAVPPQAVLQETVNLPGTNEEGVGDDGFCPFPVRIEPLSNQQITTTENPDGSTVIRFTGFASATVTNLDTQESITYKVSVPGQ